MEKLRISEPPDYNFMLLELFASLTVLASLVWFHAQRAKAQKKKNSTELRGKRVKEIAFKLFSSFSP